MRPTHFSGGVSESAISPRLGVALNIPHLNWTFRAFYGHYYQAPPLITASGPLLQFANNNNLGFIKLNGERDEEHQFGVTIPFRGWTLDVDNFRTNVTNFFDHNNIGESNLFFPVTIERAVIRGWEATLRSPRIAERHERGQPPRRTRQQRHLRRIPLEQPSRTLCRTSLPLPLLRSNGE